ncbi:class I SAM-dependent methyltransferase [Actinoallomurus liliacearum]|uniref:Class I SAM-dependent methyltransferase n=1 Tax=Actinoallomurus liliacearum TaxID=1080073 RepID=A0ABP8TGR9_9ACTN
MLRTETEGRRADRFAFGRNWRSFAALVDDARIEAAGDSLLGPLERADLAGCAFLDVGCGSGLFSLAAHRLGARVRSFDFDPDSVATAAGLRDRFAPGSDWLIEQGSILDAGFTEALGTYEIVYAWGVLHHTGDLWGAMDATSRLVAPGGLLYVSVYNDQGPRSRRWWRVKRRYNRSGPLTRRLLLAGSAAYLARRLPLRLLERLVRPAGRLPAGLVRARGMSAWHDLLDWVGGFPFEVARPEEVFDFLRSRGFALCRMTTCGGGLGCNEFVFERSHGA